MDEDGSLTLLVSALLLFGNTFFVAAEYALIGARRSKIESVAKRGSATAKLVLEALDDMSSYVAGIQIGITMFGVAIGAITEPWLSDVFKRILGPIPESLLSVIAIVVVAYPMVVIGELVPKYVTLRYADRVALFVIRPLRLCVLGLKPLVWLFRRSGALALRAVNIDMDGAVGNGLTREEFGLLVQTGQSEGQFDEAQAAVISRALRLDQLDAADIMIHRLDINWLDVNTPSEAVMDRLADIPHGRVPVCNGDIDDVLGILYVHDALRQFRGTSPDVRELLRPAEFVPENLSLDKIVVRMREAKTQILIVRDEYGGTSGLLTLEDVVEEIFGELEDSLESERPPIQRVGPNRITARADVRYDELLEFLNVHPDTDQVQTDTLATLVVEGLQRVPKLGDSIQLPIGTLRVENMARRRITRLGLYLAQH